MIKKDDIGKVIAAMRKARREEEIALYGHPLRICTVVRNKKKYSRKLKHKNGNREENIAYL